MIATGSPGALAKAVALATLAASDEINSKRRPSTPARLVVRCLCDSYHASHPYGNVAREM